jgi:hypothetical protein
MVTVIPLSPGGGGEMRTPEIAWVKKRYATGASTDRAEAVTGRADEGTGRWR